MDGASLRNLSVWSCNNMHMGETSETVAGSESVAALTSQIFDDQLQIRAAGIEVRGWTPDRVAGTVQMRVASDPVVAQGYMDRTYGPGRVIVSPSVRAPATVTKSIY